MFYSSLKSGGVLTGFICCALLGCESPTESMPDASLIMDAMTTGMDAASAPEDAGEADLDTGIMAEDAQAMMPDAGMSIDAGTPPAPHELFNETFSDLGIWELAANPTMPSAMSMDVATATISGGRLVLSVQQELGCATASAERQLQLMMPQPPGLPDLEFRLELSDIDFSPMGQIKVVLTDHLTRTTIHLHRLTMPIQTLPASLVVHTNNSGLVSVMLEGNPLDSSYYDSQMISAAAPSIRLAIAACGPDGYHAANLSLEKASVYAIAP